MTVAHAQWVARILAAMHAEKGARKMCAQAYSYIYLHIHTYAYVYIHIHT
jgi:hypothetical protein